MISFENMYGNNPYFPKDPRNIFVKKPIDDFYAYMVGMYPPTRYLSDDPNVIWVKKPIVGFRHPPIRLGRYECGVPPIYEIHPPDVPFEVYGNGNSFENMYSPLGFDFLPLSFEEEMMLTNFENMGSIWSSIKKKFWGGAKQQKAIKKAWSVIKWASPAFVTSPVVLLYDKRKQVQRWVSRRVPLTEEWMKDKLGLDETTAKIIKWGAVAGILGILGFIGYKQLKKREMI